MNTHTHISNSRERKRSHEFEREQGEVHEMIGREEREGRNDVILITEKEN